MPMKKKCPKCGEVYNDADLNFCFNDGELLNSVPDDTPASASSPAFGSITDDPPPTEVLSASRVTKETYWPNTAEPRQSPPAVWQPSSPPAPTYQAPYTQTSTGQDQTLPMISLIFGILSITLGFCCYSGFLFAPVSLITGAIAFSNIKSDPTRYGGKNLATAGMVLSGLALILYIILVIAYGLLAFAGPILGG